MFADRTALLRLLLASSVVVSHTYELIDGNRLREPLARLIGDQRVTLGATAVLGFFFLSGLLLAGSWMRDPSWQRFAVLRSARIIPGYVVASLICVFVVGPLGGGALDDPAGLVKRLLTLRPPEAASSFVGSNYPTLNASMWTIAYEARCYFVLGLMGVIGVVGRWRWTAGLGALCFLLYLSGAGLSFPRHLEIILGTNENFRLLGAFLIGVAAYYFIGIRRRERPRHRVAQMDISYGMYLYAWPVEKLLLLYWPDTQPLIAIVVTTVLSALAGVASWFAVEQPCLIAARRYRRHESVGARRSHAVVLS